MSEVIRRRPNRDGKPPTPFFYTVTLYEIDKGDGVKFHILGTGQLTYGGPLESHTVIDSTRAPTIELGEKILLERNPSIKIKSLFPKFN